MKNCKICNQTKPLTEFYKNRAPCRKCISDKYHATKSTLKGYRTYEPKDLPTERTCRTCNQTLPISEFYVSRPSPGRKSPKIETQCKSCTKLDYLANRDTILARARAKAPPPKLKPPKKTPEETRARQAAYKKHKRKTDPLFRLRSNVGTLIANALSNQGYKKTAKSAEILGCTFEQFKLHIEQQFKLGMSWNNRSSWHIDHIVPLKFVRNEAELLLLNHYTNLRPLWGTLNQNKAGMLTNDSINHPLYKQITENRICG